MLFRCQPGFENWLEQELSGIGLAVSARGAGWARVEQSEKPDLAQLTELCFPHLALSDEQEVAGEGVNALAEQIAQFFLSTAREERFEQPWPFFVDTAAGLDGLGRRADGVARAVLENLRKRIARVAKLASEEKPKGVGVFRGLYVYFVDFGRAYVAREAYFGGQRRMADDALAPSRSYLKLEEAYGILEREPQPGETVVDLGAAPGGWSYSAAKRGARVIAVDNGPLKGGALDHPSIEHRREDAFRFELPAGQVADWMFCDLVEDPHHVLRNLVEPWVMRRGCRHYVVILKFGRANPITLLRELRDPASVLRRESSVMRIRHLFHDREEFTIVGSLRENA